MNQRSLRTHKLKNLLRDRILLIDSAMGTSLMKAGLTADSFGGEQYEGCNEALNLYSPEVISKIHQENLASGADILESNTFGGTPTVLGEYDLSDQAYEINKRGAEIAREACKSFEESGRDCFVAGSMGPTTKSLSVTGGISFRELQQDFYTQVKGLWDGGVDYLLIETCQDTLNIKAALLAAEQFFKDQGESIPIAVSATIESTGTMLAGQGVEALCTSLEHVDLLYIGLNCATGPLFMTDHIRSLAAHTSSLVACVPNAGLPDEEGNYLESPEMIATQLERFASEEWINLVGGCCGTTPEHITVMKEKMSRFKPRIPTVSPRFQVSGIDNLEITDEMRPVLVGERTNVIGSKKFRNLISDENYDLAADVARKQVKAGAQIVDVCLSNPDREELSDMVNFMPYLIRRVKTPIMIDSTDAKVFEEALQFCQGKSILNSINLENGEEKFLEVAGLVRKFGAAVVVGLIDEDPDQGMAVSCERKVSLAKRTYDLLVTKAGIPPQNIIFDPLVFPCATGNEEYIGSAIETVEGIASIKKMFPECKTVLGLSNVSFGLPMAGREVLNSVFLNLCVEAGLDMAIANSQKIKRFASIPENEKLLALDLLYNKGDDPIAAFANYFKKRKASPVKIEELPLDERLKNHIVEGIKEGIEANLDEKLKEMEPVDIINGPLMDGMRKVGVLFNNNELIVAEVLASAEAMKAAVSHLEPHMEKEETTSRGSFMLATVKGDVHDIGKNLVDIILTNNGFKVHNLGIKVTPEKLIASYLELKPDIIGLSGLLVKSAHQMVSTVSDFQSAEISAPVLVGGAALSAKFVHTKIAPAYGGEVFYAKDAMEGLKLSQDIRDPENYDQLLAQNKDLREKFEAKVSSKPKVERPISTERSSKISMAPIPSPEDFDRHRITNTPVDEIWRYLNLQMLFGKHMGFKGGFEKKLEAKDPKALKLVEQMEEVKSIYRSLTQPKAVFQFFKAASNGNTLYLLEQKDDRSYKFDFERQAKEDGLCLADYIHPLKENVKDNEVHLSSKNMDCQDNLCLFVVTAGEGVSRRAEELKEQGKYQMSHMLHALALETAEAYAEFIHHMIRRFWGFDESSLSMPEILKAKYQGQRYSFGYPACPNLADNEKLFKMLKPEDIGCQITEGYMMDPEASVSALVFHHPQATYFVASSSPD